MIKSLMMEGQENSVNKLDIVIQTLLVDTTGGIEPTNVKTENWIDMGQDSYVVRVGEAAYKFYGKGFGRFKGLEENVKLYQQVTNNAKRLSEAKAYTLRIGSITYSLVINPIKEVLISEKYNVVVGVSTFIHGLNLDKAGFSIEAIEDFLDTTSVDIREQLGIHGINLTSYNTKVSGNELVITDLCPNISRLRELGKPKFK